MTLTEAPPEASPEAADAPPRPEPRGIEALLGTGDHKTIGRMWIGAAVFFLLVTVACGLLVAIERSDPTSVDLLGTDGLEVLAAYRISSLFLVALPLFLGLAVYIIPLQIGAPTLAFPRAALAAFWTWLLGSGLVLTGLALEGGPMGEESDMVDLWLVSWGLVLAGLLLATLCVVTTVITLRTPDMRLSRVPFFSWSMLVAGVLWLVTLPVLGGSLVLAYLDHHYGQLLFGDPGSLFGYLIWIFDQPAAYVAAIPALGVLAEIAPVVAGREQRNAGAQRGAIAAFGILAFGAWAQPAISLEFTDSVLYVAMAFAIAIPVFALIGGVADTSRRGRVRWTAPFVLSGIAVDLLLLAIILGATMSIESLDLLATTWQTAQSDLIWLAAVAGGLAGLLWWAPKIWGRLLPESTGYLLAALLGLGGLLSAVALAAAGALDQPAATFAYDPRDGVEALDAVALIGAVLVFLAPIVVVYAIARTLSRRPDPAVDPADPWGGQTLEWSTPSPPPTANFDDDLPVVTSATPLFEDPGDPGDDDGDDA